MSKSASPTLPLPWTGDDYESGFPVTLLPELVMMAASNAIREKPNWWEKYKDPTLKQAGIDRGDEYAMNDAQIEYIFQELEWYAERRQNQIDSGIVAPIETGIEGTRRSDGLIHTELKERLLACVQKLVDVPDHLKDWHPGSNNQVLDLVHPSLFPFISDKTRITKEEAIPPLDFMGQGETMKKAPGYGVLEEARYYSKHYQWLPTDFMIDSEGKVKIHSYINNLHPIEHKDMYGVLEEIFEKFLPMFEDVLTEMREIEHKEQKLDADPFNWYDDDDGAMDEWYENRVPRPVEIPEFVPPKEFDKYELRPSTSTLSSSPSSSSKKLQVIIKLANIILTPENPKYPG
ncbi:hypothetical protein BGZ65_007666, partial [Modicella reniformis]